MIKWCWRSSGFTLGTLVMFVTRRAGWLSNVFSWSRTGGVIDHLAEYQLWEVRLRTFRSQSFLIVECFLHGGSWGANHTNKQPFWWCVSLQCCCLLKHCCVLSVLVVVTSMKQIMFCLWYSFGLAGLHKKLPGWLSPEHDPRKNLFHFGGDPSIRKTNHFLPVSGRGVCSPIAFPVFYFTAMLLFWCCVQWNVPSLVCSSSLATAVIQVYVASVPFSLTRHLSREGTLITFGTNVSWDSKMNRFEFRGQRSRWPPRTA